MQVSFSRAGLQLCLSANRRRKYLEYVGYYLRTGRMTCQQASELGGRLAWLCNALFGRCGRAYLVPILRRAANPAAQLPLNGRLRSALKWWRRWLLCPDGPLTRSVSASPPGGLMPPALTYTDASTDYGLGGVLLLPMEKEAFFFRTPAGGHEIDFLECEAAVVADALFVPMLQQRGYHEEISFVDNNVSLAWITDGCAFREDVDPLIEDMWFNLACRQAFKWWERVSSISNVADLPSRGHPPVLSSEWALREIQGVRRWEAPACVVCGTWGCGCLP